jgi:hypothetical protein
MEAHLLRARVCRAEPARHSPRPQAPCGSKLRDLFQEIVVRVEEERDSLCPKELTSSPASMADWTYAVACASVKATSWTAVDPRFPDVIAAD